MATPLDVQVRENLGSSVLKDLQINSTNHLKSLGELISSKQHLVSLYDLKSALRIIQLIKQSKGHLGHQYIQNLLGVRCEVMLPSKE